MTFRLNSNLSLSGKKEGSFMYKISELYDLDHTLAKDYLAKFEYPWQALSGIKELILELGKNLGEDYVEVKEHVWVHKSANVFESAYLELHASLVLKQRFVIVPLCVEVL